MRKHLLLLSLATLLLVSFIGSDKIINKWEVVMDASEKATRDSIFYAQLASIDTLTQIPEEILQMKQELNNMSKESIAELPKEMVQMLNFTTLEELKNKLRATIMHNKQQEGSTNANRKVFYEFTESGFLKMYSSDDLNDIDSTLKFELSEDEKVIKVFENPVLSNYEKDTTYLKVLHLSTDSLSLLFDYNSKSGNIKSSDIKLRNFKLYKENN